MDAANTEQKHESDSRKPHDAANKSDTPAPPQEESPKPWWRAVWDYIRGLVRTFFQTLAALLLLIFKTPYMLLPSTTHTTTSDQHYDRELVKRLEKIVDDLELEPLQKQVIKESWLDQVRWTGGRATRERNADELIRWWMIILGVLIPVFINMDTPVFGDPDFLTGLASWFGVFVAVLTAVYQFRRPEERWRHYRKLHERYLMEFWRYLSLAGDYARDGSHKAAFPRFNEQMLKLREDDVSKFFGEVVARPDIEQIKAAIDEATAARSAAD